MKLTNKQLKNIVAFCALMQKGESIISKSPDYIEEKFLRYALSKNEDETKWGLDKWRLNIVDKWIKKWQVK